MYELHTILDQICVYFKKVVKKKDVSEYIRFRSVLIDVIVMDTDCFYSDLTPISKVFKHDFLIVHFIIYERSKITLITAFAKEYSFSLARRKDQLPIEITSKDLWEVINRLDTYYKIKED